MDSRSSILDHIYVNQSDSISKVTHSKPIFGDHELVMADVCIVRPPPIITFRRDWRNYSKEKLNCKLCLLDLSNNATDVQEIWNDFELKLIDVIDELALLSEYHDGNPIVSPTPVVERKLNLRN